MMTDKDASDALDSDQNTQVEPEAEVADNEEGSFYIPKDIIGDRTYKEGDKLTLEVMGTDEDGDLEVCFPGMGNWQDELRGELNKAKA